MDISLIEKHLRPEYLKKQSNLEMKYVGLSPQAFFQIIPHIDDDYLTDWEVMKFRETFKSKFIQSFGYPILIGVGFFVASPYLLRLYSHRIVFYRFYKFIFACNMMTMSWMYLNTKTWSSKPLHEVITQPEPNGKYVRTILKENFPGNWSLISKELHNMGYDFKEMNEYSDKQTMPDVTYKFDDSMY